VANRSRTLIDGMRSATTRACRARLELRARDQGRASPDCSTSLLGARLSLPLGTLAHAFEWPSDVVSVLVPWVVLAAAGTLSDAPPASSEAAPTSERIALAYEAPAECPGEQAFRAEVRERASGDWEARPGELARRITVSITSSGEGYLASVAFLDRHGVRILRSLSGQRCADVVNGIALVTALAIQSRIEEALSKSEPAQPKAEPSAAPKPTTSTAPPASAAPPRDTRVRFGAAARVASGTGPDASFGPLVFAALEWRRARLGLGFSALFSGRVTESGLSAHYRRLSGRIDGCPYAFGSRTFALEPCAFFEAGSLRGQGVASAELSTTSSGAAPWLVPGVLLRLVSGWGPAVVELEVGGGPPLIRERYGVTVDGLPQTKFRVPAFAFDGALGLGLRF
jgi:hypothetical protein